MPEIVLLVLRARDVMDGMLRIIIDAKICLPAELSEHLLEIPGLECDPSFHQTLGHLNEI